MYTVNVTELSIRGTLTLLGPGSPQAEWNKGDDDENKGSQYHHSHYEVR